LSGVILPPRAAGASKNGGPRFVNIILPALKTTLDAVKEQEEEIAA